MKKLFTLIISVLFIGGCAHTNELMNYDLKGKKAHFEERVLSQARTIQVEMNETKSDSKDKAVSILEAVVSVSSAALSAEKISDLKESIDTYELIFSVAEGIKETMETYIDLVAVDDKRDADFIIETELERCVLNVAKDNVHVTVQANTKIIDRATGKIVWENWESDTVPVGRSASNVKVKKGTESNILTALQLASLSKEEINACVGEAAIDVGREMGETFREDLAESKK